MQDEILKIVWFGNTNNIYFLCQEISRLMSVAEAAVGYQIDILSSPQALDMAKEAFRSALQSARKPWTLVYSHGISHCSLTVGGGPGPAHVSWLPLTPIMLSRQVLVIID